MSYSIALHASLFVLAIVGLPSFFEKKNVVDSAITVEILPVSEFTNVAPKKAKPKAEPKKEVTSATKPKKSMADPNKKPEPIVAPEPPKPEPKKEPEVKEKEVAPLVKPKPPEEKKKEEKKKEEKKPEKQNEDAFASVLKSVEELDVKDEKTENKDEKADFSEVEDLLSESKSEQDYKPGLPLSLSEKDAIRQQIMQNWSLSSASGAKDAQSMVVTLRIKLLPDGTVQDVKIENTMRYNTDTFFRAMADSTVRAVMKSSPLKNLPPEKYDVKDGWREIELNFDPKEMFY